MTLSERLSELVRACFSGLWVQSFEQDDAVLEIARLCRQQHWSLATWDIDRGLSIASRDDASNTAISAPDPLAAIKSIGSLATPDCTATPLAKLPQVRGQRGSDAGLGFSHLRREAKPDDHRGSVPGDPDPDRA